METRKAVLVLAFIVALSLLLTSTIAAALAPLYFSNSTNNTLAGQPTRFSLNWTSNSPSGLSGYTFRTNNTGAWLNDSWVAFVQPGTNLYVDRYESGSLTVPPWNEVAGAILPVDQSSVVYHGSYAARGVVGTPAGSWSGMWKNVGAGGSSIVYLYSAVRFNATPLTSGNWFYLGPCIVDNSDGYDQAAVLYNNGGTIQWRMYTNNNIFSGTIAPNYTGPAIVANTWYDVEVMTTRGSGNGKIAMWVNGILIVNVTGMTNTIMPNLDGAQIGVYSPSILTGALAVYWDDVLMSTSYINPYSTSWSNVTKTLSSTPNRGVGWCVYANDTSNKWNGSSCAAPFSLKTTTTIPSDPIAYWKFDEGSGTIAHDVPGGTVHDANIYGATFTNADEGFIGDGRLGRVFAERYLSNGAAA